jgi:hypothetical protein
MAQAAFIPATVALRAEQVESWAFQAASWGSSDHKADITSHHSANLILEAVAEDEKPAITAAWAKGFRNGLFSR